MDKTECCGRPQVLLLGNGLNRAYSGVDWSKLLESIHTNTKVELGAVKKLPFPLQAVLLTRDRVDMAIKEEKKSFCGLEDVSSLAKPLGKLLELPFDHILTTNYSYELERVACGRGDAEGSFCKAISRNLDPKKRVEPRYLLHTYNEVAFGGHKHKIWHIHGEARKPQSIILGHYYYGNLLGKMQTELEGRNNVQQLRQREGKPPVIRSWLDAFIMGDVYVLGFGFDFSEMDLWWLLNRKKRENADHGELFFYSRSGSDETKLALLEAYGAKIQTLECGAEPEDYRSFYNKAIADIQDKILLSKL